MVNIKNCIRGLLKLSCYIFLLSSGCIMHAQTVQDDFEGNGNISTWFGDDCNYNNSFPNPFIESANNSTTVLEYADVGGQYANVGFNVEDNFDLSSNYIFTLKIYVPSNGLTGNQTNQISLKLQDGKLNEPWTTQSEIIKSISLDQWQTVTFNFLTDPYINLDPNSLPPTMRTDFNRVLFQVNGENNNDNVRAFIDDFSNKGETTSDPVYDYLVWSDEFEEDGPIETSKWFHQTQLPIDGSWYNGEIQHYTNREDNAFVDDGILHIAAKKETFTDQGHTKQYTSARLNSKFAFQYGKMEVRARLPIGIGTWPAIWTLGKNINENGGYWNYQGFGTTGWPACGEIDLMEHWGDNQNFVQSATHTPSSFGGTINKGGRVINTASSEFHTYTLEWYPEKMIFSIDDIPHYIYKPEIRDANTWPFDAEQYILLNFAILPSIQPSFTEDYLEIDYVRVYQSAPVSTSDVSELIKGLKSFPNPAGNNFMITYTLLKNSDVQLSIHDIQGRLVKTLVNENQISGDYELLLDMYNEPSGTYFYTFQAEGKTISKKIIIQK